MHVKVQLMDRKLTERDAAAPAVEGEGALPNQMLSEGIAATEEVEGRGHHRTVSGRKGPPNHQKLQEGLVDTPEMDESAENTQKWTKGPVHAPEVPPQQQKLTECLLTFQK